MPGIAGIVKVVRAGYPDPSQFDPKSEYYDATSTREAPRWFSVDVQLENESNPSLRSTSCANTPPARCATCCC